MWRLEGAAGLALVLYRGTNTAAEIDGDGRIFGETGRGEDSPEQLEADRKWFKISIGNELLLGAVVYVADGVVVRVREVLDGPWEWDEEHKAALPLSAPLTREEIVERYPTLRFTLGDARPMVRGKIREYITL
jgi:hypothetical protein